jgi:hypothetical protein
MHGFLYTFLRKEGKEENYVEENSYYYINIEEEEK